MRELIEISRSLSSTMDTLAFGEPVEVTYNPLRYARRSHEAYLSQWARPGVKALWLGMNPGPFGMVQTGVPFGDVSMVRDWLRIEESVDVPPVEHPARPVVGFALQRGEVSGQRLWGWAQTHFHEPAAFFSHYFVYNYCPLAFLGQRGRNITPDKLTADERAPLQAACDEALRAVVDALEVQCIVGVGVWARKCAERACGDQVERIETILHPSPASPAANRGWAEKVTASLEEAGLPTAP